MFQSISQGLSNKSHVLLGMIKHLITVMWPLKLMIPKYTPACKNQPTYITKQLWSSDNMEKLIDCLEDTDWPIIFSDPDINDQASIFTDYPNLCIKQCILSVKVRNRCDKLWMNGNIRRLIAQRRQALNVNDKALVRYLT